MVNIMTRCRQCNITILDETNVCPLCRCAVEQDNQISRINEYPEVRLRQKKVKLISDMILVTVLATSIMLICLNLAFYKGNVWCSIPVAAMVYTYLSFRMIFVSRKGYRTKVFVPMALALLLVLIIDIQTGFYGWSIDYVLPSAILVADIIILMLMLTNFRNRYSYMIMQIIVMAFCFIPLTLWITDNISAPFLTLIATGVSALIFMATLMIGGRAAKRELKIRFHIK